MLLLLGACIGIECDKGIVVRTGECVTDTADTAGDTSGETDADTDADTDGDTDADTDTYTGATSVEALLVPGGVEIIINGGRGEYAFGMTQSDTSDNWTGEDCFEGYTAGTTTYLYCHTLAETGGSLTYTGRLPLDDGETLFHDGVGGDVSYYIQDSAGACYVWGNDTAHWNGVGCTDITG